MDVKKFQLFYNDLNIDNLHRLKEMYAESIEFIDPFHRIVGLQQLETYFRELYVNVKNIHFDFTDALEDDSGFFSCWMMRLEHPKMNGGRFYEVNGCSRIKLNVEGKIVYHRDFFDAGEMLYERLPLVGSITRWVKGKV